MAARVLTGLTAAAVLATALFLYLAVGIPATTAPGGPQVEASRVTPRLPPTERSRLLIPPMTAELAAVVREEVVPASSAVVQTPPAFAKDFALLRALAGRSGVPVPEDLKLPPQVWTSLQEATQSYTRTVTSIEHKRGPAAFALVERKVAAGQYEEYPHPETGSTPEQKKALKEQLRRAREPRVPEEVVNVQGNNKVVRLIRFIPSEEPDLASLHQDLTRARDQWLSAVIVYITPYTK